MAGFSAFLMRAAALQRFRRQANGVRHGRPEAFDLKLVEMRELDGDAAEIVPDAGEDRLDLGVGFVRECSVQIVAADAMLVAQRADLAHQRAGHIRRAPAVHPLGRMQRSDGGRADRRVDHELETPRRHLKELETPRRHQNMTMILPNTCRLSSRANPRSKSASATSVSITGRRPACILARLSRMLRIEAPNEPKMRYCCR